MRVLQVGKFYSPYRGGIETVVQNLSEELAARGHEVTVLVSTHQLLPRIEWMNGVRVIRMGRWGTVFSQPLNLLAPLYLLPLCWRADIIHIHSPNPLMELFSLLFPGKKVVTFHAEVIRQKKFLSVYRKLQALFHGKVLAIVAATRALARSPSLRGKSIDVIPFGIREKVAIQKNIDIVNNKYGKYVLFVGRLVGYKGVSYLIEAMQEISGNLVVIGSGPELASCKQQSEPLTGKVFFLQNVTDEELAQFYAGCEVLVLPSITQAEAFGMVLIEAMSFGKPVISTQLGTGVDEVNENEITGLVVPPQNAKALANAIRRILSDEQLRNRLGKSAREKFARVYSVRSMAEGYEKIYQRIVNA